ncbi:MAG: hypothetical protein QM581_16210 [Pseudomonas sp.]
MTDVTTVEATTNDQPDSCVNVQCDCPTLWSLAQQFCYLRLSNQKGDDKKKTRLIGDFPARARRIAATYARLYLEKEEHGDPRKKGRYYWMALGAFASKTVACSLEGWQLSNPLSSTVRTGLGKGNFWLFQDIAAWHWYYNFDPSSFDNCLEQRDTDTLVEQIKANVQKLPWAGETLPKIDNLRKKPEVEAAFEHVKAFQDAVTANQKRKAQLENLMALARHEQGNILQKLIYDDKDFAWWVQVQRGGQDADTRGRIVGFATSWMAPKLKVAFVSACDTDLPEFENVAPETMKLEDFDSRMKWIGRIADQFHQRMIDHTAKMESELATMAEWVSTPDSVSLPQ